MNAKQLKTILDTLVLPSQRGFSVGIRQREECEWRTAIPLGLHNLAHHLLRQPYDSRGWHDKRFIAALERLVRIFNFQYEKQFGARLKFDKRRPATKLPFWVEKEKSERGGNIGLKGQRG